MEDLTGRTIGGYQIVEKIGRGGMATVFRAYQPSLDRDVAIKVLPPYYAKQDETFLQRFKREARAIAKLRHPNILMVMDFGEEDDLAYLVMEYVTAGTLKDRMKRPIRLDQIYKLVGQVGSALQYAHDLGVVHRDIKPSNIMMPKPDWALLTDFGLATMVGGGSFLTQSGMTVGTPAYMSPEQGSGERVDHRTDIYALGIMLYEMVVGEVPYTAETPMAVVVKHIVDPLPIPREKNPDVPEELQRVILKSLAKNPDDRYQRAADFTAALQAVAHSHPDWSAAEIRTVTAVRTPQVDRAETKQFEEEELADDQVDEQTDQPPQEDSESFETQVKEEEDLPPVVLEPEPEPKPEPELELEPELVSKPFDLAPDDDIADDPTMAQSDAFQSQQPAQKKKRRWPVIVGGVLLFVVCAFFGLVALNRIFGDNTPQNLANEPLSTETGSLSSEDDSKEIDQLSDREELQRASESLRNGEFDRAKEIVTRVLRRNPAMWEPFMNLVGAQAEAGEYERAANLLEIGLEAHPDAPPESYMALGWLYMEQGKPAMALDAYENTLRRYPGFSEVHESLVHAASEAGQFDRAVNLLEADLDANPDAPPGSYALLGWMYMELNQPVPSLQAFRTSIERDPPGFPEAHDGLVNAAVQADQIGETVDFLEGLREQFPNDLFILRSLAELYKANGNMDASIEIINTALEIDPDNPKVLVTAYHAFMEIGDQGRALEMIERAVVVAPEDPNILNQAGWAYLDLGQPERSKEIFEKVLPMEEQNGWNSLGLARALIALEGDQRRIRELLNTAEKIGREQGDAWLLNVVAWSFRDIEDCENAVRLFETVIELEPDATDAQQGIESCP